MAKIFISHSSANNAEALAIAEWLKENGWDDYFLDIATARGISPGERWQDALKRAADRCEAVLCLISSAWLKSDMCREEFNSARKLDKAIFGVLIESTPLKIVPREMTAEWQLCDLVAGKERQTFRVHADQFVLHAEVSFAKEGLARLKIGLQKSGLDPSTFPWPPAHDPKRAPYRGLKALEAEDAAVFFGREAAIIRGLDTLRGICEHGVEQMLVILGASGAGKSSFLRAGLWPRLKRDDRHFLPLPVIRPERVAISGPNGLIASLEAAFQEQKISKSRADIENVLKNPNGLDDLLGMLQTLAHEALESEAYPPTIVIPIDQGEELYNVEGRAESELLLSLLGHTLVPPAAQITEVVATRRRILVIVAIRSDSYEQLQTDVKLQNVKQALFNLPPLAREEFKAVIEGPAKRANDEGRKLSIEPGLTERLLRDSKGADALPLLAFTLEQLFIEHGADGDLRTDEYEAFGGVRGSIEAAVTAAFIEPERKPTVPANKVERERLLRQAFIPWLVSVAHGTGSPKRRVAHWKDIPVEAHFLLERLIEARLLVRDRRRVDIEAEESIIIEIAHEALIRQWPTLSKWLDDDKAFQLWRARLGGRMEEWIHSGLDNSVLLHGATLVEAEEYLAEREKDLPVPEQVFIRDSLKQRRKDWWDRPPTGVTVGITWLLAVIVFVLIPHCQGDK